ncbi:MAG TPA: hypothetical protein VN249_12340 [Prolixibacteraceae bacterium]|nr:hypothetical protein [Prolixibacteraceae bacterium]
MREFSQQPKIYRWALPAPNVGSTRQLNYNTDADVLVSQCKCRNQLVLKKVHPIDSKF